MVGLKTARNRHQAKKQIGPAKLKVFRVVEPTGWFRFLFCIVPKLGVGFRCGVAVFRKFKSLIGVGFVNQPYQLAKNSLTNPFKPNAQSRFLLLLVFN